MKIAAYCRVSTEKEAQIDSLEKQIEFFNEFTKKNGYELYKLYADEGISGKQIKHRKQFQQMMIDAKAKKFDKVVVKDVSRFARNTVDLLQSVRELKSYNVQVDFLNNGEVMEGGSEFILTILGAMAQQESANMSKRVKFGKDITAGKGRVPNIVFGYDKMPNERYILKVNEEEAKLVKEIFESYVYKGWGTTKIAWNLNDRGIRTKRDKAKWVQNGIVRMLKNPIYTGRVTNKKSEVTDFITGTSARRYELFYKGKGRTKRISNTDLQKKHLYLILGFLYKFEMLYAIIRIVKIWGKIMKLKSFIKITNIDNLLKILLSIGVFIALIIQIRKIYIPNNTYSKYEKSVVAEVINSKVVTNYSTRRRRVNNEKYYVYTVYSNETNETIKIPTNVTYKNGEKILLIYYNLYDKKSNKYCGQDFATKQLSYFNNGSFCKISDNSYIFCNSDYTDKIISLKIDYPDDRIVTKDYIWFYTDSHNVTCKLSNISEYLINMIKNRTTSIEVTETSLGKVYNFDDFSVLNYGENLNESLVLTSTSRKNIMDFITNIY